MNSLLLLSVSDACTGTSVQVLRQSQGSLELVDVSTYLPELKRCQGMHRWLVKEKGKYVATFAQAEQVGFTQVSCTAHPHIN